MTEPTNNARLIWTREERIDMVRNSAMKDIIRMHRLGQPHLAHQLLLLTVEDQAALAGVGRLQL